MTFAAFFAMFLRVVGAWFLLSLGVLIVWMAIRGAQLWREDDSAALPAECRFPPAPPMCRCAAPRPRHQRYLRGYWTPDGRLTTLAGAPQATGHMAFTDGELLEARMRAGLRPVHDDLSLFLREGTVTAIAYLMKKDRTKAERAQVRLAARLN